MSAPEFLPVTAVADRWQMHPRSIRRLIDAGELPAVRFGSKSLRIPRSAVLAFEAEKAV